MRSGNRATQREVNLVEDEAPVIIEVLVPTRMDHTDWHLSHLDRSSEDVWSDKSTLAQASKDVSTLV